MSFAGVALEPQIAVPLRSFADFRANPKRRPTSAGGYRKHGQVLFTPSNAWAPARKQNKPNQTPPQRGGIGITKENTPPNNHQTRRPSRPSTANPKNHSHNPQHTQSQLSARGQPGLRAGRAITKPSRPSRPASAQPRLSSSASAGPNSNSDPANTSVNTRYRRGSTSVKNTTTSPQRLVDLAKVTISPFHEHETTPNPNPASASTSSPGPHAGSVRSASVTHVSPSSPGGDEEYLYDPTRGFSLSAETPKLSEQPSQSPEQSVSQNNDESVTDLPGKTLTPEQPQVVANEAVITLPCPAVAADEREEEDMSEHVTQIMRQLKEEGLEQSDEASIDWGVSDLSDSSEHETDHQDYNSYSCGIGEINSSSLSASSIKDIKSSNSSDPTSIPTRRLSDPNPSELSVNLFPENKTGNESINVNNKETKGSEAPSQGSLKTTATKESSQKGGKNKARIGISNLKIKPARKKKKKVGLKKKSVKNVKSELKEEACVRRVHPVVLARQRANEASVALARKTAALREEKQKQKELEREQKTRKEREEMLQSQQEEAEKGEEMRHDDDITSQAEAELGATEREINTETRVVSLCLPQASITCACACACEGACVLAEGLQALEHELTRPNQSLSHPNNPNNPPLHTQTSDTNVDVNTTKKVKHPIISSSSSITNNNKTQFEAIFRPHSSSSSQNSATEHTELDKQIIIKTDTSRTEFHRPPLILSTMEFASSPSLNNPNNPNNPDSPLKTSTAAGSESSLKKTAPEETTRDSDTISEGTGSLRTLEIATPTPVAPSGETTTNGTTDRVAPEGSESSEGTHVSSDISIVTHVFNLLPSAPTFNLNSPSSPNSATVAQTAADPDPALSSTPVKSVNLIDSSTCESSQGQHGSSEPDSIDSISPTATSTSITVQKEDIIKPHRPSKPNDRNDNKSSSNKNNKATPRYMQARQKETRLQEQRVAHIEQANLLRAAEKNREKQRKQIWLARGGRRNSMSNINISNINRQNDQETREGRDSDPVMFQGGAIYSRQYRNRRRFSHSDIQDVKTNQNLIKSSSSSSLSGSNSREAVSKREQNYGIAKCKDDVSVKSSTTRNPRAAPGTAMTQRDLDRLTALAKLKKDQLKALRVQAYTNILIPSFIYICIHMITQLTRNCVQDEWEEQKRIDDQLLKDEAKANTQVGFLYRQLYDLEQDIKNTLRSRNKLKKDVKKQQELLENSQADIQDTKKRCLFILDEMKSLRKQQLIKVLQQNKTTDAQGSHDQSPTLHVNTKPTETTITCTSSPSSTATAAGLVSSSESLAIHKPEYWTKRLEGLAKERQAKINLLESELAMFKVTSDTKVFQAQEQELESELQTAEGGLVVMSERLAKAENALMRLKKVSTGMKVFDY